MPKVYMRFEWLAGWRVSFLDGDKVLPRTLRFQSEEKLTEMAERGGAMKSLADRLTHHPGDTQKVWRGTEQILSTTMAGDFSTLLESAAAALQ